MILSIFRPSQLFQSRARAHAGAAIVSSSATDFAAPEDTTGPTPWEVEEDRIMHLKVRDLKVELLRAGQSVEGLKSTLQMRLLETTRARFQQNAESNPNDNMEIETEAEEIDAQKQNVPAVGGPRKELSPVEEIDSPLEEPTEELVVVPKFQSQSATGSSKASKQVGAPNSADFASKMSIDADGKAGGSSEPTNASKMSIDLAEENEKTNKDSAFSSKMSIDEVEMPPSDKYAKGADEDMTNCTTAPTLASASKPSKMAETPDSDDRKRSRSPLRTVQSALKKLSPNRSAAKVQKLQNMWPPSHSKQRRQSSEDVDMYEGTAKKLTGQPAFVRPMPSASPFNPQVATMTGGAPRAFQATLNGKFLASSMATSTKSGSVLSEEARKKEEDRRARINNVQGKVGRLEEMRAKVSYKQCMYNLSSQKRITTYTAPLLVL